MNKKEAILTAALKLLASKGVHATPMSAIATEAGTGMGTIYNHFSNKEILINALYVDIKNKEKIVFKKFDQQQPLKTQFEAYYIQAIQFYINNPLAFSLMEQLQASPIITAESRAIGYEAIAVVSKLIEAGKTARILKDIDTNELLQFIGGTVVSFLRLYFQEIQKTSAIQQAPSLHNQLKMVWDAIKE